MGLFDDLEASLPALRRFIREQGHANIPAEHAEAGLALLLRRLRRTLRRGGPAARELLGRAESDLAARKLSAREWKLLVGSQPVARAKAPMAPAAAWAATQPDRRGKSAAWRLAATRKGGAQAWERGLERLLAFRERTGGFAIGKTDWTLREWVRRQRLRHRNGELPPDRVARLESIGFPWDGRGTTRGKTRRKTDPDALWERWFLALAELKQREGHLQAARGGRHTRLTSWVSTQRRLHREGLLSAAQVAKLEALGFEWVGRRGAHGSYPIPALKEFLRVNGHLWVPDLAPHGQLYAWAEEQRRCLERGGIPEPWLGKLRALGFPFTQLELEWEERLAACLHLLGHRKPALEASSGLGSWLTLQRHQARQLDPARRERLERLAGIAVER